MMSQPPEEGEVFPKATRNGVIVCCLGAEGRPHAIKCV